MNKKKVSTYLIITFAITYTCWWGLALLTNLNIVNSTQGIFTLIHVIGGFGPTIAALVFSIWLYYREPKKERINNGI